MREICTSGSVRGGDGNIPTYSAQRVLADVELPGVVADDDGLVQEAVLGYGAPQRAFGGDADRVRGHRHPGEAEMLEKAQPGRLIGELPLRVRLQ